MRKKTTAPPLRPTLGGVAALALVATGLGGPTQAATPPTLPPATAPTADDAAGSGPETSVTLVTGDTVHLTEHEEGRRSLRFEPGEGREGVEFHQLEIDGQLHVLPLDALPYVADGLLDKALFNIDGLLEAGLDDASTDHVPLITTHAAGLRSASALTTLEGVEPGVALESIDARALGVDKAEAGSFWRSITGLSQSEIEAAGVRSEAPDYDLPVEKVWLDAPVRASLDRSVAQIGAPTAWDAGFDGTGITVAVLDTGVDSQHPDLAGRVVQEQDFSGSGNVMDHFGHGTHVAATVGGSGAGSAGTRAGVAPGATLISGKVLGDDGYGSDSSVIAGMEWAVAADADVVNMSLGGGVTDGTDPLSQAVNTLSAETDTLFVISAGNDGPGASTIGSPGSADAALTVGAVDRDESLADFSSRGPRIGDLAVKPDLTAPGVDIVAARASGTSMGSPVDDLYTSASGTSMAAPHVAGAAALLAQQHPDWDGEQLKDALVSTALPGALTAYEQGGGRVDLTRAITQSVTGTGSVHLGTFEDGATEPVTREVTYTNTGAEPVELTLDLDVSTRGGDEPSPEGLSLSAETVSVPAGGTASVTVTVNPGALERGQYTGQLHATSGDTTVHTTLAVIKVAPTHEVTFRGVGFDGESSFVTPLALFGEDPRFDTVTWIPDGNEVTVTLGEGDYFLHAMMNDEFEGQDASIVVTDPDLEVTGDMEVVLDARETTRVQIRTPQQAVTRGTLGFNTYREFFGRSLANLTMEFDATQSVWVTPTEEANGGVFEFTSRWQLAAPPVVGTSTGNPELQVLPLYERSSPVLESQRPLELVFVGEGTPEDYAGVDVTGKVAVVRPAGYDHEDVDAAVAAGAAAVMVAPEYQRWTKYTGRGDRLEIPVVVLRPADGDAVLERLGQGKLEMKFSGNPDVPYTYDVMQVSQGRVPEEVVHTVTPRNSATISANYHEMGGQEWAKEQRFAWRPWQRTTSVESQQELHTPQSRTETVSGGDTLWRQHVLHFFSWDTMNPIQGGAIAPLQAYEPGEKLTYDWFGSVVRPVIADGLEPVRSGDTLSLRIPEIGLQEGQLHGRASARETSMTLREDGQVIAEGTQAWGDYRATSAEADYQLDLTVARESDSEWEFSTRTDTSWTFHSQRPEEQSVLPLLRVDYEVPVGLRNTVAAGSQSTLGFTVTHPSGAAEAGPVKQVSAWTSYDSGVTWQELGLRSLGKGEFTAQVKHPRTEGPVSLRVEAADAHGNTVEQTVIGAYGVGGR
ncbi:S8 family peptidase [Ornithinimicrobium cavernae]|uniref:S8 family peptidase n=1 Tax=Ornithinimicrobium cavernae TaxID=2666047 RepID=UPI000D6956BF|nr:S8 family serine peptidase [Ornithinimicrobium cavernae]